VSFLYAAGVDSLPADASRHNTERLVADLVLLVEHEEIRWSSLSLKRLLAVLDSPLELFGGDQDFPEYGIDSSLATVKARCSNDCVLVVEQEPGMSGQRI
jgi:hypothetical protein